MATDRIIGLPGWPYRILRALTLTAWAYSTLVWLYLAARIIINGVAFDSLFIDAIPWLGTFLQLAEASFLISMVSFFIYLVVFWRDGR
jgi:hypothetical protein